MRKHVRGGAKILLAAGSVLLTLPVAFGVAAAGSTDPAAARACPAARAPDLPRSSPWQRNGWLSPRNRALSQRILADQARLGHRGIYFSQWGPDSRTGRTRVYLTHYTAAAARAVYTRYGCAVEVATVSQPVSTLTGRQNDSTPFRGGDFLWIPSVDGFCTGGPIVTNSSGEQRMLMAGHCASGIGKFVYRSSRKKQTDGPHMGNVTQRSFCSGCIDAAVVDSSPPGNSYSTIVWGGGDDGMPSYTENGTDFPRPGNCTNGVPGCAGDLVTNDSAFTKEKSGLIVEAVNQTVDVCSPFGGTCPAPPGSPNIIPITGLSEAVTSDGSPAGHEGDSGGPWVVHNGSGTVAIAGVTSNGICSGGACDPMYYTQIGVIDSQFGETSP